MKEAPEPTKINSDQKLLIDTILKADRTNLEYWKGKFKEAKEQMEFWERQVDISSKMALRGTIQNW
jgi:hypothetical protein